MKNKKIYTIALIGLIAIMALGARIAPHNSDDRPLYVSRVVDGDTVELSNGETVRYIGIDAPETREKVSGEWVYKPMPYAEEAKEFNRSMVERKIVRLEFDVQKKDRYNRLLSYVYVGEKMVNLELVREGYAMIYTYPPNLKYVEGFVNAQKEARENKKGLWSALDGGVISSSEARINIGKARTVEAEIIDTYISERVLILRARNNFKVVIFKDNLKDFPSVVLRSPQSYFKNKIIRVQGIIQDYKGHPEIVINDPSQIEILN